MAKQNNGASKDDAGEETAGDGLVVLRDFVDAKTNTTHKAGDPCPKAHHKTVDKWKRLGLVGQPKNEPAAAS